MTFPEPKFVVLTVLDGWGIAPDGPGNAITQAKTPNMDKLWHTFPHTELEAAQEAVGLPHGEDGNTETGHLNLGAGRIVYQDLERINMSIADGTFFSNKILLQAIEHAKTNNSNLHLMGLVGAGGVHSNINHLFALIQFASKNNFKNVFLHIFTDGRDSPPTAAKTYINLVEKTLKKEGIGQIASIMGRYWAMDRDQRWDRTAQAYFALTRGVGNLVSSPQEAIEKSYSEGLTDEFIKPSLIAGPDGKPTKLISDNDSVVFFNFRIDRPRQLTQAFVYKNFSKVSLLSGNRNFLNSNNQNLEKEPFQRGPALSNLFFVTMTDYGKDIQEEGAVTAFPPEIVDMPLSGVFSESGLRQLKITESEKERFVTFYFNGLREIPYPLEDRIIIPSPKVPTYDIKPEMSGEEVTNSLLKKLESGIYAFTLVNYPNPDMVGHTGNLGATVAAIEFTDEWIGKIANFILAYDGMLIITADHGNAEELINLQTGEIDTEHSTNRVPFIAVHRKLLGKGQKLRSGILADVAPTILNVMQLPVPSSMTGRNLLAELKD